MVDAGILLLKYGDRPAVSRTKTSQDSERWRAREACFVYGETRIVECGLDVRPQTLVQERAEGIAKRLSMIGAVV